MLLGVSCSPGGRIARTQIVDSQAKVGTAKFEATLTQAVNAPWHSGNHITSLVNGDAFFPAMLEAIKTAEHSITFETYAYIRGTAAYQFTGALCASARRGVKVHMILDSAGSIDIGEDNIDRLRKAGVQLVFFHPYSMMNPLRYNSRDHRKIMVVDGKVGFTGGCGVADAWMGNAQSPKHWRENQYRVTGPVVADMQHAFNDNWQRSGGTRLQGPDYFPPLSATGQMRAQMFISSPKEGQFTVPHLFRQAIASARKSIIIENSYFIPDRSVMDDLLHASRRGVQVEVLVPGKHIDAWPVRSLARSYYPQLLSAGVRIFEYQPTMMHCKVLVVDDLFCSIGSANFDPRSLYINDESNLNVMDAAFAREQRRIIEIDKRSCIEVKQAIWPRSPVKWLRRFAAQVLAPQL